MKYEFKPGRRISGDAQKIGEELAGLFAASDGNRDPEDVIEFARDSSREVHKAFTWDDAKAGHQWRLQEARQLIRAVVTVVDRGDGEVIRTPLAVHVPPKGYSTMARLAVKPDEAAVALATAGQRVDAAGRALEELESALAPGVNAEKARRSRRLVQRAARYVSDINIGGAPRSAAEGHRPPPPAG